MAAQDDPTPWPVEPDAADDGLEEAGTLHGRGYFSKLGIVRRKPCPFVTVFFTHTFFRFLLDCLSPPLTNPWSDIFRRQEEKSKERPC